MFVSEVEYKVAVNKSFVTRLQIDADHLIWLIRGAVERMTVDFWENNERIAHEGLEEEFDCLELPFGLLGHEITTVEFIPYPRGIICICLRDYEDTVPNPRDKETIFVTSKCVREAPVKTRKELGLMKAVIDLTEWSPRKKKT